MNLRPRLRYASKSGFLIGAFAAALMLPMAAAAADDPEIVLKIAAGTVKVDSTDNASSRVMLNRTLVMSGGDQYSLDKKYSVAGEEIVLIKQFNLGACCSSYSTLSLLVVGRDGRVTVHTGMDSDESGTAAVTVSGDKLNIRTQTQQGKALKWIYANGSLVSASGKPLPIEVKMGAGATSQPVASTPAPAPEKSALVGDWRCNSTDEKVTESWATSFRLGADGSFAYADKSGKLSGTYTIFDRGASAQLTQGSTADGKSVAVNGSIELSQSSVTPSEGIVRFKVRMATYTNTSRSSAVCISAAAAAAGKTVPGYIIASTPAPAARAMPAAKPTQNSGGMPTQGPRGGLCDINPAACDAIQQNENRKVQAMSQKCQYLLDTFGNTPIGNYQLAKNGCR